MAGGPARSGRAARRRSGPVDLEVEGVRIEAEDRGDRGPRDLTGPATRPGARDRAGHAGDGQRDEDAIDADDFDAHLGPLTGRDEALRDDGEGAVLGALDGAGCFEHAGLCWTAPTTVIRVIVGGSGGVMGPAGSMVE